MIKERINITVAPELLQKIDLYSKEHSLPRSSFFEQAAIFMLNADKECVLECVTSSPSIHIDAHTAELVKSYVQAYLPDALKECVLECVSEPIKNYIHTHAQDLVKECVTEYFSTRTNLHTECVRNDSVKECVNTHVSTRTNLHTECVKNSPDKECVLECVSPSSTLHTMSPNMEPDYVNDPDAWPINQNCERGYIMPRMPLTWDEYKTDSDWYFASDYWWQHEPSAHPFMSQTLDAQQSAAECCGYLLWGPKGPHKPFNQIELQMLKFAETKPEIQERCFAATGWRPAEPEEHIPLTLQHIELPEIEETPLTSEQAELMERVKKVAEKKNCGMFEAWDLQRENEFFIPEEWELIEKKYMQDTTPLNLFVNIAVKDHLLANESMCRDLIKFLREKYPLCESWKMLEARAEEGSFTISDLCEELIRCGDSVKPLPEIPF